MFLRASRYRADDREPEPEPEVTNMEQRRLTDQQREELLADLRAGQMSQTAIARKHGISTGTITRYAKRVQRETGVGPADIRAEQTARAVEARRKENDAKHAELVQHLREDVELYRRTTKLLVQRRLESEVNRTPTSDPEMRAARNAATILGIVADKYKLFRDLERPQGEEESRSLLSELVEGLRELA